VADTSSSLFQGTIAQVEIVPKATTFLQDSFGGVQDTDAQVLAPVTEEA